MTNRFIFPAASIAILVITNLVVIGYWSGQLSEQVRSIRIRLDRIERLLDDHIQQWDDNRISTDPDLRAILADPDPDQLPCGPLATAR